LSLLASDAQLENKERFDKAYLMIGVGRNAPLKTHVRRSLEFVKRYGGDRDLVRFTASCVEQHVSCDVSRYCHVDAKCLEIQ
jgi:hypothetical protein